jgi:hypothetical protein
MTERVFLEDVAKPYNVNALGNAKAWEVRDLRNDSSLPPVMYIVESAATQRFLLGRGISGRPKFNLLRYISKSFIELFYEQLRGKELSQYIILRGAYPLDLQPAIGLVPPYDLSLLPTGFVKLQRVLNWEGTDWEIHGQNLIGEYHGDTWLIPEAAVASGSTVAFFLRNGFISHTPKQVYLFTVCGSMEGIQRIHRECRKAGVELIPVFCQCMFEVSKTGNLPNLPLTDLSVLNPGSMTTRGFHQKAFDRYQGKRMCSVGNISMSFENPLQYSLYTLREMQVLGMDPQKEDWEAWSLDIRGKRFQKKVQDFNPDLFEYFKEIRKEEE